MSEINRQLHTLHSKLWYTQNYDYATNINLLRSKLKTRIDAVPLLHQKIIQYVKEIEELQKEIATISRGRSVVDKIGWSSMCKDGHHGCKGKNGTCLCPCHGEQP